MALNPQQFIAPNPQGIIGVTALGTVNLVAGVPFDFNSLVIPSLRNQVTEFQSLWIDATQLAAQVTVLNDTTQQYAIWRAGSYGWQAFLAKTPLRFRIRALASGVIGLCASTGIMPFGLENGGIVQTVTTSRRVDIPNGIVDTQFLAENARREGFTVWNESPDTLYLLLDSGVASALNYTVQMGPGNYFESPFPYAGEIRGIWSAASGGGARLTEFSV